MYKPTTSTITNGVQLHTNHHTSGGKGGRGVCVKYNPVVSRYKF